MKSDDRPSISWNVFYLSLFSFSSSCPLGHASCKKKNYLCCFKIKVKPLIQFQDKLKIVHVKRTIAIFMDQKMRFGLVGNTEKINLGWLWATFEVVFFMFSGANFFFFNFKKYYRVHTKKLHKIKLKKKIKKNLKNLAINFK